ncbi:MAG: ECs_2282 family putative zinc-binding protein [Oceanicaulis sp.]
MSGDKVEVTFKCQTCGGSVLELPENPTDDSIAKCKTCGIEFGTWGAIQAKAREAVLADMTDRLKGSLKGWKAK